MLLLCTGILIALLLPAVQSAREAARRSQCNNNLRQIGIAFHNYHDVYKTFPPAYIPDEDGQPMHSWRVLILPFMEQQALYEQYDFDEPWDSPHNQLITSTAIPAYKCPSAPDQSTETNYMVITGQGTLFEKAEACSVADISDGTSNTILVVEVAGTGVNWAEPRDLDVSTFSPPFSPPSPDAPGSYHSGGLNVALGDGSTHFLSNSIDPATARSMATRAGGEQIQRGFPQREIR
jgi:prepilin-type processing-associated H-X9-DG protein